MATSPDRPEVKTHVQRRLYAWLDAVRKEAPNYPQSQFCVEIGLEATHLNKILKGTMAVGPKVIARISKSVIAPVSNSESGLVSKSIPPDEAFRLIESYLRDEFDQIDTERNAVASTTETTHGGAIEAHIVVRSAVFPIAPPERRPPGL